MIPRWAVPLALATLASASAQGTPPYGYRSPAMTALVDESYLVVSDRSLPDFYTWFEGRYAATPAAKLPGSPGLTLRQALEKRGRELAALRDPAAKTRLELDTGAWLHRLVKATIPNFSLERGYEFAHTVGRGERQCLLQSTLISGMLQSMGVDSGIVMVWKNAQGKVSNLGHVVSAVRLADGRDVLVDASEPTPFYPHPGLFTLTDGQYRFIEAQFRPDNTISGYRVLVDGSRVSPGAVGMLPWNYVRSQYFYYRGERVPGGFINGPKTPQGRAASARFLEQAVRLAPQNPLATYVLGLVYQRQGRAAEGRARIEQAYALYRRYGFVPDGPRGAFEALSAQSAR